MTRDLPPSVRRSKVVTLILESPPSMPKCWHSMREWQDWLMVAHASGERITKRMTVNRHTPERTDAPVFLPIDYCTDCTAAKKSEMQKQGRCFPVEMPLKEVA